MFCLGVICGFFFAFIAYIRTYKVACKKEIQLLDLAYRNHVERMKIFEKEEHHV